MRRLIEPSPDPSGPVRRGLLGLLWLVATGLVALVAARLLGAELGSPAAAAMGLLPILLTASMPLLLGAVLLRHQVLSVAGLALVATQALLVAPSTGAPPAACAGTPFRVVGANLLKLNGQPGAAVAAVLAQGADVVSVPEATPVTLAAFAAAGVPHILEDEGALLDRTALLSRTPMRDAELRPVSAQREPRATVDVAGVPVRVYGVHPQPPITGQGSAWRSALRDLDKELEAATGPAIAVGDFNGDRDFASFRALLTDGVRDAHEEVGRGLARTWPQGEPGPPVLHLDHVLVKDGAGAHVSVCDVREFVIPGSDHYGVVADLAVAPDTRPPASG